MPAGPMGAGRVKTQCKVRPGSLTSQGGTSGSKQKERIIQLRMTSKLGDPCFSSFFFFGFWLISFRRASHLPAFFPTMKGKSLLLTTEHWSSQIKLLARNWALWKMTRTGRLPTTSQEWGTIPWHGVCVSPKQQPCQKYAHLLHSRPGGQIQCSKLHESRSCCCICLALEKMLK